jgi:hypothetical protein
MTEAEWLTSEDPWPMLEFLKGKASERKIRLFACACCRRIWDLITEERHRKAVELVEQYVEGIANAEALGDAFRNAFRDNAPSGQDCAAAAASRTAYTPFDVRMAGVVSYDAAKAIAKAADKRFYAEGYNCPLRDTERAVQAHLLRDSVGNPFRPVTVDVSFVKGFVTAIANGVYDQRAFDGMPILADALEDAGCADPEILEHCRGPGPHVRGCWVVDLLLGKS